MRIPYTNVAALLAFSISTGIGHAALYGIYRESATGTNKHVVSIDPGTGEFTDEALQPFAAGNPYNWGYSAADQTAYGAISDSGTKIMKFDTVTKSTAISPVLSGPGTFTQFNIFDVDRDSGNLYAIMRDPTTAGNPDIIGSVDFATGGVTQIGTPFDNGGFTFPLSATFDSMNDSFVFVSNDPTNGNTTSYFSISATTGVASISAVSGSNPSALGHDHVSDTLFGLFSSGGTGQLASINPLTGVATNIGAGFDLTFWEQTFTVDGEEGTAYLTGRTSTMDTNDRAVYSVDLATGAATVTTLDYSNVSPALANGPNALFAATVPEPGSLSLMLIGAGLLAFRRKKSH